MSVHRSTLGAVQAGGQAYSEVIFLKDDAALENFKILMTGSRLE